ncbi:MAG: hypothetical protein WEB93_05145 [Sphingomonadales bacterium]
MNERLERLLRRGVIFGRRKVPPGVRSAVGVVLMIGGVFGILPILGFWMFPLGVVFVALDIPPLRRRFTEWQLERKARRRHRPSA